MPRTSHEKSSPQKSNGRDETEEAHHRTAPTGRIVYKAILQEADDELSRTTAALFYSALAAGLCMGFSHFSEALLRRYLPEAPWTPLISKLGYCVGFVIVIMARQQLFTEDTLTPIIPLLKRRDRSTLLNVLRLWGIVLLANLIGACVIALVGMHTSVFDPETKRWLIVIAERAVSYSFGSIFMRGVFAGWLIATLVWMLPAAEGARLWAVIIITYFVGLGGFAHIIAGSVEAFALTWAGERGWGEMFGRFLFPALSGNIVGGVTLAAGLNHAQVVAGGDDGDID